MWASNGDGLLNILLYVFTIPNFDNPANADIASPFITCSIAFDEFGLPCAKFKPIPALTTYTGTLNHLFKCKANDPPLLWPVA